ncbi:MAG: ECF transporter S component [bacterium]|nr:ECF transporter S component [bacterium]
MNTSNKLRNRVITAVLTAIIFMMANIPFLGYIPLGVIRATIIHVPVIIGAVLLGPTYGAFLGAMFGMTSLLASTFTPTLTSFIFSPFYRVGDVGGNGFSLIICFVPRILIGVVAYYVYVFVKKHIKGKARESVALMAAGIAGSMTNTLLVMNMVYLFFGKQYAGVNGISIDALYGAIMGIILMNGVPEAIVAAILTTAIAGALKKTKITESV